MQFSGVQEIPESPLRAVTEALVAGHVASLSDVALEAGTTPLGSGGYAIVFSGVLSSFWLNLDALYAFTCSELAWWLAVAACRKKRPLSEYEMLVLASQLTILYY